MLDDLLFKDDTEALGLISAPVCSFTLSFSRFSPGVDGVPRSMEVPGVLGVLAEDPKDANAPDPSPNAEDAPVVGEATAVVLKGEIPLKGLDLPLAEPSPPNRFAAEYGRGESLLLLSLLLPFELEVDRESLLELFNPQSVIEIGQVN